jgi:hypothetical protein
MFYFLFKYIERFILLFSFFLCVTKLIQIFKILIKKNKFYFIAGQLFLELSFHVKHKLLIEKKTNQLTNQSPNQQQQWQSTPHEHI